MFFTKKEKDKLVIKFNMIAEMIEEDHFTFVQHRQRMDDFENKLKKLIETLPPALVGEPTT